MTRMMALAMFLTVLAVGTLKAQPTGYNYDESKVPAFSLPDPLVMNDGERVTDAETWRKKRRPEILRMFETHVYGRSPGRTDKQTFKVTSVDREALGGKAIRKEVSIFLTQPPSDARIDLLIYLPRDAKKPSPAFVGLNFNGNHSIRDESGITLSKRWMRKGKGVVNNRATEASRGANASRWAVEKIVGRGYALATIYCGDIDPDYDDDFQNGVHPLFYKGDQKLPAPDEWGTIAAWAWGLSRALDYFETDDAIDAKRVAVIGHSRLGKTALWAGAQDERFAIVISNNSGCGGAALSRRQFGETVKRINTSFPHWFCDNFEWYNDRENQLPVDQHMLVALCAPRPVYIASAEQDRWADPRGEFLSAKYAEPVYQLLAAGGLGAESFPEVDRPVKGRLGYHMRSGAHNVTDYDWQQYLDFADTHYKR